MSGRPCYDASDVLQAAAEGATFVLLHRHWHLGEHVSSVGCWCSPLFWDGNAMREPHGMQRLLDEFFAVH